MPTKFRGSKEVNNTNLQKEHKSKTKTKKSFTIEKKKHLNKKHPTNQGLRIKNHKHLKIKKNLEY